MKKYIEGLTPFNDIYYKNCFYNSFFPILNLYGISNVRIFANDIVFYKKGDNNSISIDYIECEDMNKLIEDMGMSVVKKSISDDIISDIIKSIDNDRTAIIWIDCYYEPIRKDMFMKKHWGHTLLIYGYDTKVKTFSIIEHQIMENLKYQYMTISFNDVLDCYKSYIDMYFHGYPTFFSFYSHYGGNITSDENIKSKEKLKNNIRLNEDLINNGMITLKEWVDQYNKITYDQNEYMNSLNKWMEFINSVINNKKVELYKNTLLLGKDSDICLLLDSLIKNWDRVRSILGIQLYTKLYNEKKIKKSKELLIDIVNSENAIVFYMFNL